VLVAVAVGACATSAPAQLPTPEPEPTTTPATARIAFRANLSLYTIAADGSGRRRLTTRADEPGDLDPAWAPDGRLIAFTRYADDPPDRSAEPPPDSTRVMVIGADGSGERPLTASLPRGTFQSDPAWSPDGRRVAYVETSFSRARSVDSVVTTGPSGEDRRVLHSEVSDLDDDDDPAVFFEDPAWSPNGEHILFTRSTFGGREDDFRPALHLVPSAGGDARRLLRDAAHGSWSPDGNRIAYSDQREPDGKPCKVECIGLGDIAVMNADGSARTRLTTSDADDAAPSWSGDGNRIVFHSDRNALLFGEDDDGPTEIYSIRPDGTCLTWLTNGTAHSSEPAWEPGATLSSEPGGCEPAAREPLVETDTSKAEAVTRFPVWWLGRIAPNGLLLTDVGITRNRVHFHYGDCGRFDPDECGRDFVNVQSRDLCASGTRLLTDAGRRGNPSSIFRGALLNIAGDVEIAYADLYSGRSRIIADTASGHPMPSALLNGLRLMRDDASPPGAKMPAARLPVAYWRTLTSVTTAHRRLGSAAAVARRLKISRSEVIRRLAAARRLAELGVKRRLGCSG
jgi:TolB protein